MESTVFTVLEKIERNLSMTSGTSITERMQRCIEQATLYLKKKLGHTQCNLIFSRFEGRGHTTFADLVHLIRNEFHEVAIAGINHDELLEKPLSKRINAVYENQFEERFEEKFAIVLDELQQLKSPAQTVNNVGNVPAIQSQPLGGQLVPAPVFQPVTQPLQQ